MKRKFSISKDIIDRQDLTLKLYLKDLSKEPLISYEKELELIRRIKEGDQKAINELVKANLRFVVSIAKQYQHKGVPLIDLIQEGNIGLIKSTTLFDESKGIKFISYAVWWIRQSIIKALSDYCRTVRLPVSQIIQARKANKALEKFDQLRNNSDYDYSDDLDFNYSVSKSVSLESAINDEFSLIDILPNENSDPTDYLLQNDNIVNGIEEILEKIPCRNSDIIRMSFGIGMKAMLLEEIAKYFGVSGERIRQLQHTALKQLKHKYSKYLKELYETI